MAENSKIEWTDSTFNPWSGCTKVSPGCEHCYAEGWSKRAGAKVGKWGPGAPRVRTSEANWRKPVQWNAQPFVECAQCGYRCELREFHAIDGPADFTMCPRCSCPDYHGARRRVFCASLADVFDNEVDPSWRAELFALIAGTPNLDWLLLTKRIGNVAKMIEAPGMQKCGLPPNVWLGATVVNQEEADRDVPKLLATPAAVRFLSMEPLLGAVDLTRVQHDKLTLIDALRGEWTIEHPPCSRGTHGGGIEHAAGGPPLDWVIAGGESGPGARPMHPDWARSLRDQCAAAGVPFLFKQWGEWLPGSQARDVGNQMALVGGCDRGWRWDNGTHSWRIGKKAAGRLLDGVEHNGFPGAA